MHCTENSWLYSCQGKAICKVNSKTDKGLCASLCYTHYLEYCKNPDLIFKFIEPEETYVSETKEGPTLQDRGYNDSGFTDKQEEHMYYWNSRHWPRGWEPR